MFVRAFVVVSALWNACLLALFVVRDLSSFVIRSLTNRFKLCITDHCISHNKSDPGEYAFNSLIVCYRDKTSLQLAYSRTFDQHILVGTRAIACYFHS